MSDSRTKPLVSKVTHVYITRTVLGPLSFSRLPHKDLYSLTRPIGARTGLLLINKCCKDTCFLYIPVFIQSKVLRTLPEVNRLGNPNIFSCLTTKPRGGTCHLDLLPFDSTGSTHLSPPSFGEWSGRRVSQGRRRRTKDSKSRPEVYSSKGPKTVKWKSRIDGDLVFVKSNESREGGVLFRFCFFKRERVGYGYRRRPRREVSVY